jgi:hypothetical protein
MQSSQRAIDQNLSPDIMRCSCREKKKKQTKKLGNLFVLQSGVETLEDAAPAKRSMDRMLSALPHPGEVRTNPVLIAT